MQYGFDTESVERGEAALLLYALYRSRDPQSALNGIETWNRCTSFAKGAAIKSTTTAEFCDNFCKMAKIQSIRPKYLKTDDGLTKMPDGSYIQSENIKDYKIRIIENDKLVQMYRNESQLLVILVRERIQREKLLNNANGLEDEEGKY